MDGSIRECSEKFVAGSEAKEEHLKVIQESVTENSKELDLRRQSIEKFLDQVKKKEGESNQMQLAQKKGLRDWELKKKEMDLMWKKLEGQQKLVAKELEKLENFQKSLNEKWKIKEKILAFRAEALDAKEKELVARERLLDLINTDEPNKNPNGANSEAECSTRSQSKKRRTMTRDSVKDRHNAPAPRQQPHMPLPAPQATTGIPEQGQQAHEATTTLTPTPTPSSSVVDLRIVIRPLGDSFSKHEECVSIIQDIFDRSFEDNRLETRNLCFSQVPADVRDALFTEFKQFFCWLGEHDELIRANWNNKCNCLFGSARKRTLIRRMVSKTRIVIEPLGDSFSHRKECLRVIQDIFDSYFEDNRLETRNLCFFQVPVDVRYTLFTEFKQFFCWSEEHDRLIRANWNNKCNCLFSSARNRTLMRRMISPNLRRTLESRKTLLE